MDIAKEYGWSLEYIDTLPYQTINEILAVRIGTNRARDRQAKMNKR